MRYLKIVFFAIILFFLATLAYFNAGDTILVLFRYGGISYETVRLPLFVFFFIAILVTIIVMSILGAFERTSLRLKVKKLEKENKKLKDDLEVKAPAVAALQDVSQTDAVIENGGERKHKGLFGRKKKARETTTDKS